jgi:hypothetical protein
MCAHQVGGLVELDGFLRGGSLWGCKECSARMLNRLSVTNEAVVHS